MSEETSSYTMGMEYVGNRPLTINNHGDRRTLVIPAEGEKAVIRLKPSVADLLQETKDGYIDGNEETPDYNVVAARSPAGANHDPVWSLYYGNRDLGTFPTEKQAEQVAEDLQKAGIPPEKVDPNVLHAGRQYGGDSHE